MNKLRWGKFYWSDWSDDPALAACSLAAQGLWMRLLCIAAQGTPYGHVVINGTAPDLNTLAKLVRCKRFTLQRLIAELERRGVASRGDCGCLVSRRMESDGQLAGVRAGAAKSRWNKEKRSGLHMQNMPETESQNRESESPPVAPRKRGARERVERNGFVESVQEVINNAQANQPCQRGATVVAIPRRAVGR